jgi:L-2,4-diaminobutyrate decarboxylase
MDVPLFLTSDPASRAAYRDAILHAADLLLGALPAQPYSGATPRQLDDLFSQPPDGEALADWARELRAIVAHSVNPAHPWTVAHLHSAPLIPALAAEAILSALNQSMDSFDQAPAATIIEQNVLRWLCSVIGLPSASGGTFTPGGTVSNYMGLLLARDHFGLRKWNWRGHEKGLPPEAGRYRFLCSAAAHFSVAKSAMQLGLGTDSVTQIPVDDRCRMRVDALADCLAGLRAAGRHPVAIVGTAGTTDFGAIDPLAEIARLARAAGAWFHVDAAYGGVLLLSAQRDALRGIEMADSVGVDFHKLLWMPVSCSALVVRNDALFDTIKLQADYLNPEAHEELGIPDLVTKSVLTTRRFDALKVWLCLRAIGTRRLGKMIDRCMMLAREVAALLARDPAFELLHEPEMTCVVFRLRGADNDAIRHAMFNAGEAVLGHTVVAGRSALKFTLLNPTVTLADYAALLDCIKARGRTA